MFVYSIRLYCFLSFKVGGVPAQAKPSRFPDKIRERYVRGVGSNNGYTWNSWRNATLGPAVGRWSFFDFQAPNAAAGSMPTLFSSYTRSIENKGTLKTPWKSRRKWSIENWKAGIHFSWREWKRSSRIVKIRQGKIGYSYILTSRD